MINDRGASSRPFNMSPTVIIVRGVNTSSSTDIVTLRRDCKTHTRRYYMATQHLPRPHFGEFLELRALITYIQYALAQQFESN